VTRESVPGCLLAVTVPAAALFLAAPLEGQGPSPVPAPFGWRDLAAVHLLAGLPLALALARLMPPATPAVRVGAGAAGALLALATLALGAALAPALDRGEVGPVGRWLVRAGWCLALQAPWAVALSSHLRQTPLRARDVAPAAFGLFLALAVPGAYAGARLEAATASADQFLSAGRLARAAPLVEALAAAGSPFEVAGAPPARLRARLRDELRAYEALLRLAPPPATAAPGQRAELLYRLDRLDEAANELEAMPSLPPGALTLLGTVRRHQGRFEDSDRAYREALARLAGGPLTPEAQLRLALVYDSLAANARDRRSYPEAERLYHQALEKLPDQRARFHFLLGQHHHQGNRPGAALRHLEEAARLDEARYGEPARRLREDLQQHTPGCLLRRR
jgi:tetratricopeptide (TPR) repeat protein